MRSLGITKFDPRGQFILSRALAAARPSLIGFLIAQGTELSGGVASPISFCNILFVGNLCAAIAVGLWFGFGVIMNSLRRLTRKAVIGLMINGILAASIASLIFGGIQLTSVTNAVLLSRFGPVLYALCEAGIYNRRLTRFEWIGFSLILVGILVIILRGNGHTINGGDLLLLGSTVIFTLSSLFSKSTFSGMSDLSVIVFIKNLVSSLIFFVIAIVLFGPHHFQDAFSGQLWIIMSIYALIVIVFAQFLWFSALGQLDAQILGRLTVLSPIFGIFYAYVLNGERPSMVQVTAFILIITGVLISSFSKQPQDISKQRMIGGSEGPASAS